MKLTKGVLNGLQKAMNSEKIKMECPSCGFKVPIYAGKYSSLCPNCGAEIINDKDNEDEKKKNPGDKYMSTPEVDANFKTNRGKEGEL